MKIFLSIDVDYTISLPADQYTQNILKI